jgi:hypothetical protein
MGNYVIAMGNYLIVSPSELGNYKIADTQCRSDSSRHWARTGQLVQTAIAAAASWRAWAGSILTGYHWSGSKPLSAHRACLATGPTRHRRSTAGREGYWSWGTASPDDLERKPWRAAAAYQLGDLVPVDVVGGGLGQRPWDPQQGELCHPPFMHEHRLMAWSGRLRFHR